MTKVRNGLLAIAIALIMIAVGFFIGSRSLAKKGISHEREDLIAELQHQVSVQANDVRRDETYIRILAPHAARLAGARIALFVTEDAQSEIVNDIVKEISESKAIISSYINIHSDAYSDAKSTQVTSIVNHSLPIGAHISPSYTESGLRLGSLLSWITEAPADGLATARGPIYPKESIPVTPTSAVSGNAQSSTSVSAPSSTSSQTSGSASASEHVSPPESRASVSNPSSIPSTEISSTEISTPATHINRVEHKPVLHLIVSHEVIPPEELVRSAHMLVHNKLINFVGKPSYGSANYAIFIIGKTIDDVSHSVIIAGIANGLADRGSGVVLVAPDDNEGSAVGAIRTSTVYCNRVNTVDNAGTVLGRAAAILAVRGGRAIGHFGTGNLATSLILL